MSRGNNNGRGSGTGSPNFRGNNRSRGRGGGGGRGRGRGRGRGGFNNFADEGDFVVQMWPDNNRGNFSPRGRGRGQGSRGNSGFTTPIRGSDSPRGRGRGGYDSPRGAKGYGTGRSRMDAPLSKLLYEERPFLRPIIFVAAVHNRVLFQEEEDILQPVVEEVGDEEQSHVPTAESVARIFSGSFRNEANAFASEDENADEIEEIDFADMAKFQAEIDAAAQSAPTGPSTSARVQEEERFTGTFTTPHSQVMVTEIHSASLTVDEPITVDRAPAENSENIDMDEDEPLGFVIDTTGDSPTSREVVEKFSTFAIDTSPTPVSSSYRRAPSPILYDTVSPLGAQPTSPDDEEIIVYVAPHPRTGRSHALTPSDIIDPSTSVLTGTRISSASVTSPLGSSTPVESSALPELAEPTASNPIISSTRPSTPPPQPDFSSVAFSFAATPSPRKLPQRPPPTFTAHARTKVKVKTRRREAIVGRKRPTRGPIFGSLASRGADLSEAQMYGRKLKDPRWEERRTGDSDVDWGDEDDGSVAGGSDAERGVFGNSGAEGMDVDPELEMDVEAMKKFAFGMGQEGGRHVTMDDIADQARMREEDAEEGMMGSSGDDSQAGGDDDDDGDSVDEEVEAVINVEEEILVAEAEDLELSGDGENEEDESEDDEEDSDDDDDMDLSPQTGFQARLHRLREKSRTRRPKVAEPESSDDEFDFQNKSWADQDDDFIAEIEAILDEESDLLNGRDRSRKKKLFRSIQNGSFEDDPEFMTPSKRRKDQFKDLPTELQAIWQKDRDKKAANKKARAQARLELAADPLAPHKGGKKGRKAMLAAAKLDPTITVLPNRIVDLTTLVQQIRRFIADIGGPQTMSLPPTDKETRKNVHELAIAFQLKSVSKGKGEARYTTLTKTTRSGMGVDERKVGRICRRNGGGGQFVESFEWKGKGKRVEMPRHREGDEIGKTAPKIGQSNIGFQMLANMGWAEGDRIGVTGGLKDPLTAVIKTTKLGLGATR